MGKTILEEYAEIEAGKQIIKGWLKAIFWLTAFAALIKYLFF